MEGRTSRIILALFFVALLFTSSGIPFRHTSPKLDHQLQHIVDYDRDGLADIYVTDSGQGSQNALYRNPGNGTFRTDVNVRGQAFRQVPFAETTTTTASKTHSDE
jgi:VCBS repeat protein